MQYYDRSKITEEPITPCNLLLIDEIGKLIPEHHSLIDEIEKLTPEQREVFTNMSRSQADHIRIQNRIRETIRSKDVSEIVTDGKNRLSLRRLK
ncbi:MAG: hypothetical protein M0Q91_16455 [Methanoregula sp.]|jgi:nucleoside-triphosphatase THEP1|nr:hypothetical protein [Methanoregula sp.]